MASARVLIVEDELLVASDLSTSLEDFGYVVAGVAKSGEEALRKAQESQPDLVLMDIVLQGEMDGIQVAERLRSALGVPVLYLTSYGDTEKLERAKLTEPYAYLAKPWVESELKAAISLALFRHQVEKKLRESENRYRTLAENSLTGICVHQDGKFVYVNKRCAEIMQYSAEELMDRPVEMVVAPADLPLLEKRFAATQNGAVRNDHMEIRVITKTGDIRWAQIWIGVVERRGGQALLVNAVDITDRKRAEDEIQAARAKLEEHSRSLEAKVRERTRHLEESHRKVEEYARKLEDSNTALKLFIRAMEEQRSTVQGAMAQNFHVTMKPIVDQLRAEPLTERMEVLVDALHRLLQRVALTFGPDIMDPSSQLTLQEIRVCEMIKSGLGSKDIARVMGVSPKTIAFHRTNIRKKLGLSRSQRSLATFLAERSRNGPN